MFVAVFNQVSPNSRFEADKNGEYPFLGRVLAGKAKGTIINGTIFNSNDYKEGVAYLCDNTEQEYNGTKQIRTEVIMPVSVTDLPALIEAYGKPELNIVKQPVAAVDSADDDSTM